MVNINLVPQEIKERITQAKNSANVFSICLVVVFLLIILGILSLAANSMVLEPELALIKAEIQKNTASLQSFSVLEDKALFLNDRAKIAQEIEQKRPLWSQIIQGLNSSVPQEVQFASFTVDILKSPNFVLSGYTVTERDVISFKDKLEQSEFFKNVKFKSSSVEDKPTSTAPVATTPPAEGQPTTTPTITPIVEKRISFSLEFDLEKYFSTETETK